MKYNPKVIGAVHITALSRELLFEDERAERLAMPYAARWKRLEDLPFPTTLELDVGSVLGVMGHLQEDPTSDRVRLALGDVGRICKGAWYWHTGDRTITTPVYTSQLTGGSESKDGADKLIDSPSDIRKYLTLNFASRDDAMLVRMSIADLRSVKNVDGGDMSQKP